MERSVRNVNPFDSFSIVNKWLMAAGFSKLYNPRNKWTKICHGIYRKFVLVLVHVYCLQHFMYIVQVHSNKEYLLEAIMLQIPLIMICIKTIALYTNTKRLNQLEHLMYDPIFGAHSEQDEIYLTGNNKAMKRLSKFTTTALSGIIFFWVCAPIFARLSDPTTTVPNYVPFKTDTWFKFLLADFMDTAGVSLWMGFGHLSVDCVIATYFSQGWVQLRIINYNLEHLFDGGKRTNQENGQFQYLDISDKTLQERFVFYIKRFDKVVWYIDEVMSIFNKTVTFQFLLTSLSGCLAIVQMSSLPFSAGLGFAFGYYMATQYQIFLFCYFGGRIENESKIMADSVYLGDWVSVSPRFRKQLLIAMARWIRPITPKVAGIVPLSLVTFLSITRSAYTLFTVLKSTNH